MRSFSDTVYLLTQQYNKSYPINVDGKLEINEDEYIKIGANDLGCIILSIHSDEADAIDRKQVEENRAKEAGYYDCIKFEVTPWRVMNS